MIVCGEQSPPHSGEVSKAHFSSMLRQEVDLDQLREQLLVVVQETMQPAHVSLWLRSQEPHTGKLSRTADPHDR